MAPARGSAVPLRALNELVGALHVISNPDVTAGASSDWTGRYGSPAAAVVRPADVAEVAGVVRLCAAAGVAIVAQGGNTGLVGGGVPHGERETVVLQLGRLTGLGAVDVDAGQMTAGAGATLRAVQEAAAAGGWRYPVDFGARDLATVGGMIATNAGGVSVFRHGSTRRQVLGVEAVLADGSIISRLDGLVKDNTGFDLAGLMCGSEGTLGIVTAARLRLVPSVAHHTAAWISSGALDTMLALARRFAAVPEVEAVELIAPECVALLRAGGHRVPGPDDAWALLADAASRLDGGSSLESLLGDAAESVDVSVALDARMRRELWDLRDAVPEVIRRDGVPLKLDVAVPLPRLEQFLVTLPQVVASADAGARLWRFGHAADGNVHVNITGAEAVNEPALEEAVLGFVLDLGGSISAEHGIGIAKAAWMERARSTAELAVMRRVKAALDPNHVLNPGVLGL